MWVVKHTMTQQSQPECLMLSQSCSIDEQERGREGRPLWKAPCTAAA